MKLTLAIPVFNEKPTILAAIGDAERIKVDKEIIIVDNYSTDGTRELLKNLRNKSLQVVFNPRNLGPGASVQKAINLATGDYFYVHHSDLEYKVNDVYRMLEKAETERLDAVFGSRLSEKAHLSKLALVREKPYILATLVATHLVNKWYRRNFTDIIATKLIKTKILKNLNCAFNGHSFEFELASRLSKLGYRIGEIPISYKPRTHKEGNKIRAMDMIPALFALCKVRFFDKKDENR